MRFFFLTTLETGSEPEAASEIIVVAHQIMFFQKTFFKKGFAVFVFGEFEV